MRISVKGDNEKVLYFTVCEKACEKVQNLSKNTDQNVWGNEFKSRSEET